VCLLGVRLNDDLALENSMTFAVEHRAKPLPALATAGRVLNHQGVVHVLPSLDKRDATDRGFGALTGKTHEGLLWDDRPTDGKAEVTVCRIGVNRHTQSGDAQRGIAVVADLYMINLRSFADNEFKRRVDLVVDVRRTREAFYQREVCPRFDHDNRP